MAEEARENNLSAECMGGRGGLSTNEEPISIRLQGTGHYESLEEV